MGISAHGHRPHGRDGFCAAVPMVHFMAFRVGNYAVVDSPKSRYRGLTLYQTLNAIQDRLNSWTGTCTTCHRPMPRTSTPAQTQEPEQPNGVLLGLLMRL